MSDAAAQDYRARPEPKGASVPAAQPGEAGRLARIRARGWIGLRPDDFAWLVAQVAARLAEGRR